MGRSEKTLPVSIPWPWRARRIVWKVNWSGEYEIGVVNSEWRACDRQRESGAEYPMAVKEIGVGRNGHACVGALAAAQYCTLKYKVDMYV